jgi:Tfp pilus assembly protein PilO
MKTVSVRTVAAVAAVASLLLVVVWYFAIWQSQSKSLSSAHRAHAAAEAQVSSLTTQASSLEALLSQVPADQAKLAQLEQELPNTPTFDQALRDLDQAATSSGARFTNISPSPASGVTSVSGSASSGIVSTTGAPSIELSMTASGSSQQITSLLANLENLPRALVIDKLALSGIGGNETASITSRIFYAQASSTGASVQSSS